MSYKKTIIKVLFAVISVLVTIILTFWIEGRFLKFRNFEIKAHNGEMIKITYDKNGIPKIQSSSIEAATFGQGCVHIIHREWQMDKARMLSQGRIS